MSSGEDDSPERKIGEGVTGGPVRWCSSAENVYTHSRIVFDIVVVVLVDAHRRRGRRRLCVPVEPRDTGDAEEFPFSTCFWECKSMMARLGGGNDMKRAYRLIVSRSCLRRPLKTIPASCYTVYTTSAAIPEAARTTMTTMAP